MPGSVTFNSNCQLGRWQRTLVVGMTSTHVREQKTGAMSVTVCETINPPGRSSTSPECIYPTTKAEVAPIESGRTRRVWSQLHSAEQINCNLTRSMYHTSLSLDEISTKNLSRPKYCHPGFLPQHTLLILPECNHLTCLMHYFLHQFKPPSLPLTELQDASLGKKKSMLAFVCWVVVVACLVTSSV